MTNVTHCQVRVRVASTIATLLLLTNAAHAGQKRDPVITWGLLSAYVGDILGPAQFNATVDQPGTLSYFVREAYYHGSDGSPVLWAGDPLPFGNFDACVEFTPTDPGAVHPAIHCTPLVVSYRTPRSSPSLAKRLAVISSRPGVIDPDTQELFKPDYASPAGDSPAIRILNAFTLEDIGTIPVYGETIGLDGRRNRLYVAEIDYSVTGGAYYSGMPRRIRVFDTSSRAELQSTTIPYKVIDVAVNESTGIAYALSSRPTMESIGNIYDDYALLAFDASGSLVTTIALPGVGVNVNAAVDGYMTVNVSTNEIYVAAEQELLVIDGDLASPSVNTIIDRVPYGESGRGLAVGLNRQTGSVYVVLLSAFEDGTKGQTLLTVRRHAVSRRHFLASRLPLDAWRPDRLQGYGEWEMAAIAANPTTNTIYVALSTENGCMWPGVLIAVDGTSGAVVSATVEDRQLGDTCTLASIFINPANGNIYLSAFRSLHMYSDPVVGEAATPAGDNAVVSQPAATLTFSSVQSAGTTSVTALDPEDPSLAPLPQEFALGNRLAFSIETSASFTGLIEVCFNAAAITDPEVFAALAILHGVNGVWVNEPVTSRDFASGVLCARVSSLSPFVIARYTEPTYGVVRLYDSAKSFKAGSTAPIRLKVTNASGLNLSAPSLVVHAVELRQMSTSASAAVVDSGQSNPGQDFRFDGSLGGSGGYIFNLKTTGLATGSYELQFTIGTGRRRYSVPLQIR